MTNEPGIPAHAPPLAALTAALEGTLLPASDPITEAERLARQAVLLDQIFSALSNKVMKNMNRPYGGDAIGFWLNLALRTQKQCADAVKSRATIEYMAHLSAPAPPAKK